MIATDYPAVTRREASTLAAAVLALRAINARAGHYSNLESAYHGRVAEAAAAAAQALTHALIVANVYLESDRAGAALDRI